MLKLFITVLALAVPAFAQSTNPAVKFQSLSKQTALVELYTSEGCSSCPPADVWLNGLKDSAGLWKTFVPVAWHVDYWNYLGWRDPWSNEEFSERERAYAAAWHSQTIYTPCFVLNGKEWKTWFRPKSGPAASEVEAGVLTADSMDQKHWQVHFSPATATAAHYQVHAVLLAGGLGSEVKAGENNGRHLMHDFVALTLVDQYLPGRTNEFQGDLVLDVAARKAAGQLAMAFWVTRINELEPVQAVGGWLPGK